MYSQALKKIITKTNTNIPSKVWWILLVAAISRLFFIWYFGDVGFESDSYAHFLYAVSSFVDMPKSLNYAAGVWQKPLFTLLTGTFIWVTGIQSLWLIKILNTIIWIVVGVLTYSVGRRIELSKAAGLAAVFLVEFSFLGFRSSISVLTEPLFTALVLGALLMLLNRRYTFSCALVSLSALVRSEGLLLIIGWVIILWIVLHRRNFRDLLILIFFPFLWDLWGYSFSNDLTFILTSGYPLDSPYGHGGWLYYFKGLFEYEPVIFPLALLGFVFTLRERHILLLHILAGIFFVFNVVAWRFGRFGTAGLLRYFVPAVPWLALYAAMTLDYTNLLLTRRRMVKYGINGLLVLQVVFTLTVLNSHTAGYNLYNTPTIQSAIKDAGEWIKANLDDKRLCAANPALLYYAGRDIYTNRFLTKPIQGKEVCVVAYDRSFSSPELQEYMTNFELVASFDKFVYLYDYDLTSIQIPAKISFSSEAIKPFLRDGWSDVERWGTWALGHESGIAIFSPEQHKLKIAVTAFPQYVPGKQQSIQIFYNDIPVGEYQFPIGSSEPQDIEVVVPAKLVTGRLDQIKFVFGYTVTPIEVGLSNDARQLSVGFLDMDISLVE